MSRKRVKRYLAIILTMVMVIAMSAPSFAGMAQVGLGRSSFLQRKLTSQVSAEQGNIALASGSEAEVKFLIDGKEESSISFYMKRDPMTNKAELPAPVTVKVTQTKGDDVGVLRASASDALNEDVTRVEIKAKGDSYLKTGKSVEFQVEFVDQDVADGKENVYNDGDKNYIIISGPENSGFEPIKIPVFYGSDGFYSFYSVEEAQQYAGTLIQDSNTGELNILAGEINLNSSKIPTLTILHKYGVYADMMGTDENGNPIPLRISTLKLNPDGMFTFPDGTTEMKAEMDKDGWIAISLKLKDDVFKELRKAAVSLNKKVIQYVILSDLVIEYNDGYLAGGNMSPLPIVYKLQFTPHSSGASGGSSSGSGSGSGSSSGIVSGTIEGPGTEARVTSSSQNDIGWVQKDGVWYYMNAENAAVTDWLLGLDGRWYFLNADGSMKTGWMQLGSTWYFLNADGAMATGWVQGQDGSWYYLLQSGEMAVNTTTPDGYSVNQDGVWVQ